MSNGFGVTIVEQINQWLSLSPQATIVDILFSYRRQEARGSLLVHVVYNTVSELQSASGAKIAVVEFIGTRSITAWQQAEAFFSSDELRPLFSRIIPPEDNECRYLPAQRIISVYLPMSGILHASQPQYSTLEPSTTIPSLLNGSAISVGLPVPTYDPSLEVVNLLNNGPAWLGGKPGLSAKMVDSDLLGDWSGSGPNYSAIAIAATTTPTITPPKACSFTRRPTRLLWTRYIDGVLFDSFYGPLFNNTTFNALQFARSNFYPAVVSTFRASPGNKISNAVLVGRSVGPVEIASIAAGILPSDNLIGSWPLNNLSISNDISGYGSPGSFSNVHSGNPFNFIPGGALGAPYGWGVATPATTSPDSNQFTRTVNSQNTFNLNDGFCHSTWLVSIATRPFGLGSAFEIFGPSSYLLIVYGHTFAPVGSGFPGRVFYNGGWQGGTYGIQSPYHEFPFQGFDYYMWPGVEPDIGRFYTINAEPVYD
jgi:hypothetical protein